MKKIVAILTIVFCLISSSIVFATNGTEENKDIVSEVTQKDSTVSSILVDKKEEEGKSLEQYKKDYGSEAYGFTAYILSKIQLYSIPFCFVGIAVSAIYQYVLGIRKLDTRDKGFNVMIAIVTLFIIAQVLPLIFAIVVRGWEV